MKALILALATLASVSQANAMTASIKSFRFQPGSSLAKRNISYGNLTVDLEQNQLTLNLQPAFYCPPGAMCVQVMPAPIEFTMPIESVTTGNCGETIYTGATNDLMVDGILQQLTVTDN